MQKYREIQRRGTFSKHSNGSCKKSGKLGVIGPSPIFWPGHHAGQAYKGDWLGHEKSYLPLTLAPLIPSPSANGQFPSRLAVSSYSEQKEMKQAERKKKVPPVSTCVIFSAEQWSGCHIWAHTVLPAFCHIIRRPDEWNKWRVVFWHDIPSRHRGARHGTLLLKPWTSVSREVCLLKSLVNSGVMVWSESWNVCIDLCELFLVSVECGIYEGPGCLELLSSFSYQLTTSLPNDK